jgi:hypothetical protein
LAEANEQVVISWREDETGAELEGVLSETMLAVAGRFGTCPSFGVIAAEQVQQVPGFQSRGLVGSAIGIDEQRKFDAGFFAEEAGIAHVAQANGGQTGSGLAEFLFVAAQLRDVLAAEDSTVVAQEDNDRGIFLPERAEADIVASRFGQDNVR